MNLSELSSLRIGAAHCCAVCGTTCARKTNPRWLQALVAGAAAHSLTIARPDALKCHDACRDRLNYLIDRRRAAAKVSACSAATATAASAPISPANITCGNG